MAQNEIHVNDVGTIFRITIKDAATAMDVSGATTKQIVFRKPDATTETQTAAFYTDGSDGIIQYTSDTGDLDTAGIWKIQAYVITPSGQWKTDIQTFEIYPNIASS